MAFFLPLQKFCNSPPLATPCKPAKLFNESFIFTHTTTRLCTITYLNHLTIDGGIDSIVMTASSTGNKICENIKFYYHVDNTFQTATNNKYKGCKPFQGSVPLAIFYLLSSYAPYIPLEV